MKELLKNLALSLATFALCFLVLEGILRIAGYGNLELYEPDPALFWRLRPNQDCFTKIDHKPVHVNSAGTRGPEFAASRPEGSIRILSLGDSRTFGWGMTEAEAYSGRLETMLREQLGPTRPVEVINAGVNAWSYPQLALYLEREFERIRPDWVIVGEANLWTQFSERSSPEFVQSFMNRVRLKNLLRRMATYHYIVEVKLKDLYERQRTRFIPVDPGSDEMFRDQQQKDPDAVFGAAIERIARFALDHGATPVLLYLPTLSELQRTDATSIVEAKRRVATELGVPFVDMTADMRRGGHRLYLEADPVHLSIEGNDLVATRLDEVLLPLLRR